MPRCFAAPCTAWYHCCSAFKLTGSASDTPIEVASRLRFLILASLLFILVNIGAVFAFRATIPDDATFARDELDRMVLAAGPALNNGPNINGDAESAADSIHDWWVQRESAVRSQLGL